MVFAYIRVSSEKQTVENQRHEIKAYAKKNGFKVDEWIEETVSGTVKVQNRALGERIKAMRADDRLIVSEISRIGRSINDIFSTLNIFMEKGVQVFAVKENFQLGDNINSKVLAFAFGLAAEIERNLISQRTKEALQRKRAEGVVLGRPKSAAGELPKRKLDGKDKEIQSLLDKRISVSGIARMLGVHRLTVSGYIDRMAKKAQEKSAKIKVK